MHPPSKYQQENRRRRNKRYCRKMDLRRKDPWAWREMVARYEGAKIGKNCLIGAKALIPEGKEIPDNSLVMGAPGQIKRQVTEQHIARMRKSAEHYVANWQRYRRDLRQEE